MKKRRYIEHLTKDTKDCHAENYKTLLTEIKTMLSYIKTRGTLIFLRYNFDIVKKKIWNPSYTLTIKISER